MAGQVAEQLQTRGWIERGAAQHRLQGQGRFVRRDALPQPRRHDRMLAQGVVLPGQDLIDVRRLDAGDPDDHGVGGEVAQTLGAPRDHHRGAADQVERREEIDEPQQVARDDLAERQTHPALIENPQTQKTLADRLAAPQPLRGDAVSD